MSPSRSRSVPGASIVAALMLGVAAAAPAELRTPWGDPDLQGIWSNATLTPLERPPTVDREYLTEIEAHELDRSALERTLDPTQFDLGSSGESSAAWVEPGRGVRSRRTSLVVDPPSGKVPYTAEGLRRRSRAMARLQNLLPLDSWEDLSPGTRCLSTGDLLVPNSYYLDNHRILQTPEHVAIRTEYMNETRIIPLDGRPPLDARIKLWSGSSRGRWEGETLVVETTNFNDDSGKPITSSEELRLVERFTRVDADTIDYELTVTDPVVYQRPWTLANTLRAVEGPIYEYACHEGNYSLVNILAGARAEEAARERDRRLPARRFQLAIVSILVLTLALFVYWHRRRAAGRVD